MAVPKPISLEVLFLSTNTVCAGIVMLISKADVCFLKNKLLNVFIMYKMEFVVYVKTGTTLFLKDIVKKLSSRIVLGLIQKANVCCVIMGFYRKTENVCLI